MTCENTSAYFLHLTLQYRILIVVLGAFQSSLQGLLYRQAEVNFLSKIYEKADLLDDCN